MTKDQIQTEALNAIGNLRRAGVDSSMGTGKTMIGIKHMVREYNDECRFLIVGSKLSVLKAWLADMKTFGLEYLTPHVKFTTYRSLHKQDLDYDVVYLDECHNLKFTHDAWLSQITGKIIGLTGTPPKKWNSERGIMVTKYCPIVFVYKTSDAISDKILNSYKIIIHMLDLDTTKNITMTSKAGATWNTSERASYDYWTGQIEYANPARVHMTRLMRMKAMQGFPSKEKLAKHLFSTTVNKVLLFANTKDQADRIYPYSYHSTNPKSEQNLKLFMTGEITKLTSVQQLNESVNIPKLKELIIMHAFGNERVASQKIGRGLRLSPDDEVVVRILCYRNTVDVDWVKAALEDFDQTKITYV